MKTQTKVKFIILSAIAVTIAMLGLLGFQLFKIHKIKQQISSQQQEISSLQEELDYYKNKKPNTEHDVILGEN